jgi:hypothetical protein
MTVTVRQVDEIVAINNPVLRNLKITVAYGRMAREFAGWIPGPDLSWCAFGTWASEGVGGAIRRHHTDKSFPLKVLRFVRRGSYEEIAAAASTAFAEGNQAVFDHIGRAFARFHEALAEDSATAIDDALAGMSDVPGRSHRKVKLDLEISPPVRLADGFTLYLRARDEPDPARRAQLVAAANLCLAHVEQVRLQKPIDDAFGAVLPRCWRESDRCREVASRFVTEVILTLPLGDEVVHPGHPLPPLDGRLWPEHLEPPDDELFARFVDVLPGADTVTAPEAAHWTSLRDRLTYIAALMRSRQQVPKLAGRLPFTPAEVALIDAGRIPDSLAPKPVAA